MNITLQWNDKQDRHFSLSRLHGDEVMICTFTKCDEEEVEGWCRWKKEGKLWHVIDSSRGDGRGIAKESFSNILDDIWVRLIAERELIQAISESDY